MSSQVWVPESYAVTAMRLAMAAEVCQNVRIDIQNSTETSKSFWGTKEKFNPVKYNAHVNEYLKDFYASLQSLNPTEKKIYLLVLNDALNLFQKNTAFKKLLPTITEAEHIENINASKEIQLQAMATFLGALLQKPEYSHLCDTKYEYLWA